MSPDPPRPEATYEQAVRSWTEHLRGGGSTPWSEWVGSAAGAGLDVPPGWQVPGAAQLEFLRRAAQRAGPDPSPLRALADLVLARSGPGRGLAQQPLSWPGGGTRRFGAPPADPSDVPDAELVRVGVGALTELLLRAPHGAEPTEVRRRRFSRSPAFALAGAPVSTSAVRRYLADAGHAEGGRSPLVVLLAEPLDAALAQVWSARVQRGAPVRWPGFVARWAGRRRLPPSADYAALARRWADRVGPDRVHVVVAPGGPDDALRQAAEILGVAPVPTGRQGASPRWKDLAPAEVDLLRRVNSVLNVRTGDEGRATARRTFLAGAGGGPHRGLTVPEQFRDWALTRARAQAEDLRAGGYPVHGDPERLLPAAGRRPTHPHPADVLEAALDACLGRARTDEQLRRAEHR